MGRAPPRVKMGFDKPMRLRENASKGDPRMTATGLIIDAFARAQRAVRPATLALLGFVFAAAAFATFAPQLTLLPGVMLTLGLWAAGLYASATLYRHMLELPKPAPRVLLALAHANFSLYAVFGFVAILLGVFLTLLAGILLEAAGYTFDGKSDPVAVRAAFSQMLGSAYGTVFALVALASVAALIFMALRLTLVGAATAQHGATYVFRSWDWTRGAAVKLGLASLVTHVVPFGFAAFAARLSEAGADADTVTRFFTHSLVALVILPFIVLGHGLGAAALQALQPKKAD